MNKITDIDKAYYEISLPSPLDKPMNKVVFIQDGEEMRNILNELVDRQNAITELLKKIVNGNLSR